MGLNDTEEKYRQAVEWFVQGTAEQQSAAEEYLRGLDARPWCPEDCGCRLGPDERGNHDADTRECGCGGPCTEEG